MRIVRYRGKFYAAEQRGGRIIRTSLRTDDPDTAAQRLEDLKRVSASAHLTVGGMVDAYLVEHGDAGMRWAWKQAAVHFGPLRPDQITEALCDAYITRRRRAGRSDGTIIKEIGVVRTALRWAQAEGAQFRFPRTPAPRERHLSRDEFARLVAAASISPHVEMFVRLALATGARAGALLALTWMRVDLDRRIIRLAGIEPESRKRRATVPINDTLFAALERARQAAVSDFVIERNGRPVASIRTGFEGAVRRAGLGTDVTPHVLRHTAAVWMAEAGVPMEEIAQYLGHSDVRTTYRVYARFSPSYLRRAAAALEA